MLKTWQPKGGFEAQALEQLKETASLPFIHKYVAAMPDAHYGKGATVGSVIPTKGAIIPAAVGVDIGCGMVAVKTSVPAERLPDSLDAIYESIVATVPVKNHVNPVNEFKCLEPIYKVITANMGSEAKIHPALQLGTLGGGNHFIELCLDESDDVWIMLHSGSRGVGNNIGQFYISAAKREMERYFIKDHLPNSDLAYLVEHTELFDDYWVAMTWAQEYAALNRECMLASVVHILQKQFPDMALLDSAINCHHNYSVREKGYYLSRKGAIDASKGKLGIIPGSMGAKSYIVEGKGNYLSFNSCSHGAGRCMSRRQAKETISLADHANAVSGIKCRKDLSVLDESPAAYKNIDDVMAAQEDLVTIKHTLKQVLNVKG